MWIRVRTILFELLDCFAPQSKVLLHHTIRTVTMYVCVYVCVCVCMYVCMYACMYACMHTLGSICSSKGFLLAACSMKRDRSILIQYSLLQVKSGGPKNCYSIQECVVITTQQTTNNIHSSFDNAFC